MSAYHLPIVLKQLREIAPSIEVKVFASNTVRDLTRREADIAIRHVRPSSPSELSDAVFIGFEHSDRLLAGLNALGLALTKSNFKLITNSGVAGWKMVKQGLGIGVMVEEIVAPTPGVECVLPQLDPIPVPIWLTAHRELRTSPRIRLVFDLLAEALL